MNNFLHINYNLASYPSGLRDRFAKPSFAGSNPADASPVARVVELVDTADLKSVVRMDVPVRVRPWVLIGKRLLLGLFSFLLSLIHQYFK